MFVGLRQPVVMKAPSSSDRPCAQGLEIRSSHVRAWEDLADTLSFISVTPGIRSLYRDMQDGSLRLFAPCLVVGSEAAKKLASGVTK